MERIDTPLPGVALLEPTVFEDHRGFFMESFNQKTFADLGIDHTFVQDNHSKSSRGVLRGLHYQLGRPQAKLVRVTRGRIYDVAVDIRRGSPHFGGWAAIELSAENRLMIFVPEGFAHGLLVLSETAEVQYRCTDFYSPEDERGIAWNDPGLGIDWPLEGLEPILSERDTKWSSLELADPADLPVYEP